MAIEIQKGIPAPNGTVGGRGRSEVGIALRELEVGDSFAVPVSENDKIRGGNVSYVGGTLGRKFKTRTVIENGVKMIRVWRTE